MARVFAALFSGATLVALVMLAALVLLPKPPAPTVLPPLTGVVERIVVEKSARRLELWQAGKLVRSYPISLGFSPDGDKSRQGDGRTPVGMFRIDRRNDRSAYHLSLGLDYPQASHRKAAQAGGFDPGGDIMIHGQPNALPDTTTLPGDWTAGCIAITNAQMRELWRVADVGTIVEIRP